MITEEQIRRVREKARGLRHAVVDMIGGSGKVGHLGGSCSCADIVAALYYYKMRYDAKAPDDPKRDRLLLSKGHAALVQYAALADLGYFDPGELTHVKALGAMLQGHPDRTKTPGIEANTGSLGQGLSIGLGMALGLKQDGLDGRVFVILGDGEIAEGQIWEAAMAAASYRANNLIAIVDRNGVQATGPVAKRMDTGKVREKWEAFGWKTIELDGHNISEICNALDAACRSRKKPTALIANTIKGKGVCFAEGKAEFHNAALNPEQVRQAHEAIDTADGEAK